MTLPQLAILFVVIFITSLVILSPNLGKEDGSGKGAGVVLLVIVSIFGTLLADGIGLISTL